MFVCSDPSKLVSLIERKTYVCLLMSETFICARYSDGNTQSRISTEPRDLFVSQ